MTEYYKDKPKRLLLLIVALLLLAGHFTWIASTWQGMGYTKDEGYYFSASKDNFGWYRNFAASIVDGEPLRAFEPRVIDRYWRNNHEHPPFCKAVQGFHHMIWYEKLGWLNFGNSHRMATWSFSALLVVFMLLLATEWMSLGWAIFSLMLLFTLPRVFFHNHLNTFDMPVTAMWFVIAYAFRRSMESVRWGWITGVLLGVGLATKNNAYFLPVLFAIMYLYSDYRKEFFRSLWNAPRSLIRARWYTLLIGAILLFAPLAAWLIDADSFNTVLLLDLIAVNLLIAYHYLRPNPTIPRHLAPIWPSIFTAPFTFFLLWPWIWHSTWPRLGVYFNRHLHPPAWETYYLHDIIVNPPPFPWHYPFVMSAYTIPAAVLFLILVGFVLLLANGRVADVKHNLWRQMTGREPLKERSPLLTRYEAKTQPAVIDAKWDQLFILVNILLPILIIANPKTPIYGGTKHWMNAAPYYCIAATLALRWIVNTLANGMQLKTNAKTALTVVLAALCLIPGLLGIRNTHPNTLSYYNEIMGGSIAAPEVGVQRTFWAVSTRQTLEYINKHTPENGSLWFNNTPWDSFRAYQTDGFLRQDIRRARNEREADFAVMNHWRYYTDGLYKIRDDYNAKYGAAFSEINGLPLTVVVKNNNKISRQDRRNQRKSRKSDPAEKRNSKPTSPPKPEGKRAPTVPLTPRP